MRLSTVLLILLILVITTLVSKGQITIRDIEEYTVYPKIDTLKTRILCCVDNKNFNTPFIMFGYEVRKIDMPLVYPKSRIEWSYLDEDKKPLSNKVVVWMSKPIEK